MKIYKDQHLYEAMNQRVLVADVVLAYEIEKLKELFENCRDATGYSDDYFRGMYNGIEWALSCLTGKEPEFKSENSGVVCLDRPIEGTQGD